MALADTANLMVKLSLGGNFLSQIGKATSGLSKFDQKLGQTESRAFKAGQKIGTGIKNAAKIAAVGVGFLVTQIGLGLNSLIELEKATAQTEAVIKSTGGTAGVTAGMVRQLAEQFESLNATVGDEFIQSAENLLLTFTNIRKDAFEPTLQAALDMNQALGGGPDGLAGNAKLLGKALQDPEKGLSRLGRAVGGFSDETIAAVKAAIKQNDTLKAQNIILAELEKRYGGSFARAGNTAAGKIAGFTDAIEDLQRALAEALLPTLGNVADALSKTLRDPAVVAGMRDFGKSLAGLVSPANLAEAGRILGDVFSAAREAAPIVAGAAKTMFSVVQTAVGIFRTLPPEIQKLAIGALAINKLTGGLVTNLAGGLISAVLKQLVSGVVNVNGAVVNVNGAAGLPGLVPGAAGAAGAAGGLGAAGLTAASALLVAPIALAIGRQMSGDPNVRGGSRGFFPGQGPGPGMIGYRVNSDPHNWPRSAGPVPVELVGGGLGGGTLLSLISRQSRTDIRNRAIAAGHRNPSEAAITTTANRNQERWANAQKAATERTTTAVNNVRAAVNAIPAITIRDVNIGQGRRNRYGPDAMGTGAR